MLKLPKNTLKHPRCNKIEACFTATEKPLKTQGSKTVTYWELDAALTQALKQAAASQHFVQGLEQIQKYLDKEAKGLRVLQEKTGQAEVQRLSRLLLLASDGSDCFYHNVESLCIDGVYTRYGDVARFRNLESVNDEEVASLVESIANRVRSLCITAALAAKVGGKIAFGPNAGNSVRKIGAGFGNEGEVPLAKGKRCYSVGGFSLHANTAINTHAPDRLYKLIACIDRLEILANGDVKLALKTPWANGTTHLVFTPSEFTRKLIGLIPPTRGHLGA